MAPQAATCLLAATILVTVPAGHAQAEPSEPSTPSAPAQQRHKAKARSAGAERPKGDADTLREVKAYNRYRRSVARQKQRAGVATAFARRQIGKPYGWGASGPSAYDCSGLVMRSWREAGVRLPRVSYAQYRAVPRKVSMDELRPGDLVFFSGRGHVGMYVSKNRFIHAPSRGKRIRIDRLSGYRKRTFAGAVRPGAPAPRKFPANITKLAEQLDEQGILVSGRPRRTPVPVPPAEPEPRPVTSAEPPESSGDTPSPADQALEDSLPEAVSSEERTPPGR